MKVKGKASRSNSNKLSMETEDLEKRTCMKLNTKMEDIVLPELTKHIYNTKLEIN